MTLVAIRPGTAIRVLLATSVTALCIAGTGGGTVSANSPGRPMVVRPAVSSESGSINAPPDPAHGVAPDPPPDLEDVVLRRRRTDDPRAWLSLPDVAPIESLPFATPAPRMPGGATDEASAERAKAAGLEAIELNRSLVAITELEKARAHRPDDEVVLRGLARSYFSLGNASRAIDDYRRLLEVAPNDREALHFISLSLFNRRMPAAALTALLRLDREVNAAADDQSPGAPTAVERVVVPVLLAAALRQTGHDRAAIAAMRRALDLLASMPVHDRPTQPNQASRNDAQTVMQRQFADIAREQGESWIAVGDGHARLGEWTEALDAYATATEGDPSQLDQVRARRTFVLLILKRSDDALASWLGGLPEDRAIGARESREATWLAEASGDAAAVARALKRAGETESRPGLLRLSAMLLPDEDAAALRLELLRKLPGDALLARALILGTRDVATVIPATGRAGAEGDGADDLLERAAHRALSLIDEGLIAPEVAATLLAEAPARPAALRHAIETLGALPTHATSPKSRANAAALVTAILLRLGAPGDAWRHALAARDDATLTPHRVAVLRAQLAAAAALEEHSLIAEALGWSDPAAGEFIASGLTIGPVEPELIGAAAAALIRVRESNAAERVLAQVLTQVHGRGMAAIEPDAIETLPAAERAQRASTWLEIAEAWLDVADSRADSSVRSALAGRPGLPRSTDWTAALEGARAAAEAVLRFEPNHAGATRILIEAIGVGVHAGIAPTQPVQARLDQLRERFRNQPQWSAVREDCAVVSEAAAGRWNEACRRMALLVEERPQDRRLLSRLTNQWPRRGSPDDACDWFRGRVERMPSNARGVEGYVASLIARGDTVRALEWLEDRVAGDPQDQVAGALLEALEWSAGRGGSAAQRAELRLRQRPAAPMRELSLAQLAWQRGRPDESLSILQSLEGHRVSRREWAAAVDLLDRLEPPPDGSAELLLQLVDRLLEAPTVTRPGVTGPGVTGPSGEGDLRPETLSAAVVAEVAVGSGRAAIDRRVSSLARLVNGTMSSAEEAAVWIELAQALVDAQRPEVAGDALRRRLFAEPRLERGEWMALADAAATADVATRDPARTRAFLREVLPQRSETGWPELPELPPDGSVGSEALVFLSGRWTLLLETDGAIALLRHAIDLDSQHGMALNNLGYALLERDGPTDEVVTMIERAAALVPGSASVIDSLAWLRFRQGRIHDDAAGPTDGRGAATLIKRAVALAGNDLSPELLDHAGDVAWVSGNREDALVSWRRAVALVDSDFPRASTVKALEQHQRQAFGLVVADSREIWDESYGRPRERARRKIEQVEQGLDPL